MDYPGKAKGDNHWKGGLVNINEKGGELVDLPRGSRIYPHDQSIKMAYQDGMKRSGNTTVNIPKLADQIVVRQEADIDLIATKLAHRLEKTSLNLGASQMGYQY
jgi:phage-related protein